MILISVIFGLYIIATLIHTVVKEKENRIERERLEDRLMAMSKPEALITHKAVTDPEPAEVTYMDEKAEYALDKRKNGHVDLLGDD